MKNNRILCDLTALILLWEQRQPQFGLKSCIHGQEVATKTFPLEMHICEKGSIEMYISFSEIVLAVVCLALPVKF